MREGGMTPGFTPHLFLLAENKIDGTALHRLTERATELLIPIIGDRMKFLHHLDKLKAKDQLADKEGAEAPHLEEEQQTCTPERESRSVCRTCMCTVQVSVYCSKFHTI